MRYIKPQNWSDFPSKSTLMFMAQRMSELSFDYTMDSYKAPTTSVPYLIRELKQQIELCSDSTGINNINVLNVFEELKQRSSSNHLFSSLSSFSHDFYFESFGGNLKDLLRKVEVMEREIEPRAYCMKAMELIDKAVDSGKKIEVDYLCRELVSVLNNIGMSNKYIQNTCNEVFFSNTDVSRESLNIFFQKIFPRHREYSFLFKVETATEFIYSDISDAFGIKKTDKISEIFCKDIDVGDFGDLSRNQQFIQLDDVKKYDLYSAIKQAENKIVMLSNLFTVFHHKNYLKIDDFVLVAEREDSPPKMMRRGENRMLHIQDNRPAIAATQLKQLFLLKKFPSNDQFSKFTTLIDFHGMSVSGDVVENQLLNMWISLETIVPSRGSKSKIENVVSGIIPFIGIKYFERIFSCLAKDIYRWNRRSIYLILKEIKDYKANGYTENIVRLCLLPEYENLLEKLFHDMGDFELLRYRIFDIRKKMRTPRHAMEMLDLHIKRVSWQIKRIYRARNSIVHAGNVPAYTGALVENAHDYFDQTFLICCDLFANYNGFKTFDQCFDFVAWNYDDLQKSLRAAETFHTDNIGKLIWKRKAAPDMRDFFQLRKASEVQGDSE